MKKILLTGALITGLTGLAGCSSDADDNVEEIVTNALLNGTWEKACVNEPPDFSFLSSLVFNNGKATVHTTEYSDLDCVTIAQILPVETFDYALGGSHTLDGTVAGITHGTEINITNFITPGDPPQAPSFDAIATNNLIDLYFTDEEADPLKDASSADKRPITLAPSPFIKQQ